MFKLVISDDEGKTTVVPLVRDEITIGRKEGNTIRLTERNVSRRHAKLAKENGAFVVEDLGSYNGVKVNGRRIEGQVHLKAGDQLSIGDYLLALQLDAIEAAASTAAAAATATTAEAQTAFITAPTEPRPPARLVMLTPPAPGAEFALSRDKQRVGRAEDLPIWVNHRSISREHAEIVREGSNFRLLDLGSANGVRVNGRDARDTVLSPGDVVELGQVRFRFVGEGESYAFEADRTVQMDAIDVGPTPSRAPLLAAAGILIGAVAVAAIVAIGGGDDEDDQPVVRSLTPSGEESASGMEAAPAPAAEDLGQLVEACQTAVEREAWADALSAAERALSRDPSSSEARSCQTIARAGEGSQAIYQRGLEAFHAGQMEVAVQSFMTLPDGSPYASRPEVPRASNELGRRKLVEAERHLAQGRREEANHLASEVIGFPGLTDDLVARADAVRRGAEAGTQVAAAETAERNPRERNPRTLRTGREPPASGMSTAVEGPREQPEAATVGNPITECLQSQTYSRCIVQRIPRPNSQREIRAVAEAYRDLRDPANMCRWMRVYTQRYNDSNARTYAQVIQVQCN